MVLSESELERIAEIARRHNLWLVSDEVYAGLASEGRVPSLAARLPEQVVTVSSLSKTHAMTGWRAGWLIGPRQLAIHAEALAMCMLFGLPGFIQEAAIEALAIAPTAERRMREYLSTRCTQFMEGLQGVSCVRAVAPQAGMFMLLELSDTGLTGYEFMRALFESERVAVMDGAAFGAQTAGYVRICVATEESVIAEACARIRRFLSRARPPARRETVAAR